MPIMQEKIYHYRAFDQTHDFEAWEWDCIDCRAGTDQDIHEFRGIMGEEPRGYKNYVGKNRMQEKKEVLERFRLSIRRGWINKA